MPTRPRSSSSLLSPKKAPATRRSTAAPTPELSLEEQLIAGVDLPPIPDTPPPVPEGEVLGFGEAPDEATAAAPITEDLTVSGETPVDPVTGEAAFVPETTTAGRSEELKAELKAAEARRQAEHAAGKLPATTVHSPGTPAQPLHKTMPAEHDARQRAYKEHMLALRRAGGTTTVVEPEIEDSLDTESAAEAAERARAEAKLAYLAKVEAMEPDEPRYVATGRAPRPKVCGHTLAPGDVVPGAYLFTRLESWLNAKTIRPE